jgi:hypothetical protein
MMRRARALACCLVLAGSWLSVAAAYAATWPQEIVTESGTIVVYQPQPESFSGNVLKGRAAMSLEVKGRDEPIFGAFWFDATVETDKEAGTVLIQDIKVTNVRWPDSKDAEEQRFTAAVEGAMPESGFEISLEALSSSLKSAELEQESLDQVKNDPPNIVFREELSVLVLYDGKPRFAEVEGSDYERALNTPMVVVRKKRGKDHYLSSGRFWYTAKDPMGPWTSTNSPPADLVKMLPPPEEEAQGGPSSPPAVVTADKPTELISTQGKPDWQSLPGGEVLFVQNTETPWLRDLPTNNMYVLLSGRWFRSKSTDGPWTFVRADELPESFANIPPESDIGGLRSSVAGTPEAEDAVLDAHVPQTAAIKRDEAKLTVEYDGSPKFEKISGTSVSYAVNTASQVLEIGGRYYAVDNGVWFTSSQATGPWVVADSIPEKEIQEIPPSSPVYNTTHVHVYESTPEVVYVGYTPGYMWSFPYYGVPIYGTGWYYPPYVSPYRYYPHASTWGFNVGYNPWTGWSFGLSWTNGFFSFGMSWGGGYPGGYYPGHCCGGWYGGGYRGPVFVNTGDINIGNNVNIGNRTNIGNQIDRNRTNLNIDNSRTNLYNRPENRARNADSRTARQNLQQARPASNRANDVFADRDGNVARNVGDNQWETRQNGQWSRDNASAAAQNVSPETRERASTAAQNRTATPSTSRSIDHSSLNRDHQARQRGASRQMSRPQTMRAPVRRR